MNRSRNGGKYLTFEETSLDFEHHQLPLEMSAKEEKKRKDLLN